MSFRNLSPMQMFTELARDHVPLCRFNATTKSEFSAWHAATLPKVMATLGDFPEAVPHRAELMGEWQHDGLRKQRWLIDVGIGIAASFLVNYPAGMAEGEKRPAILCWHGHGEFGKEPVMGNDTSPELRADIALLNYSYGHEMAKSGFITFAIDWLGAGDRNDGKLHNGSRSSRNRDWCNLLYLHATMLGMTSLSINVQHGKLATDFACTLPGVDPDRLGVMGLSGGGAMTTWSALCDERFRATEIIGYSNLWAHFGLRDNNYCGLQIAPGLYKQVDLPDLQGLIAPRPLLVDIGAYDSGFSIDAAMNCYHQVENIYKVAGASDKLEIDLFPGEHGWGGNKSAEFFGKYL